MSIVIILVPNDTCTVALAERRTEMTGTRACHHTRGAATQVGTVDHVQEQSSKRVGADLC